MLIKDFYQNIGNYRDSIDRRDYWMTTLYSVITTVVVFVVYAIVALIFGAQLKLVLGLPLLGYLAATNLSFLSMLVRRIRDTGKSPWLVLLAFIPVANLYVLYLTIFE